MDIQKEYLVKLLTWESAHDNFHKVAGKFPASLINLQIPGTPYTPWHLIEHIRIAQRDNLDYVIGTGYKELSWPKDYWPEVDAKATKKMWEKTIEQYDKDLKKLINIIKSPKTDLHAILPHTKNASVFRQVLIVVDHASYHVGELSLVLSVLRERNK